MTKQQKVIKKFRKKVRARVINNTRKKREAEKEARAIDSLHEVLQEQEAIIFEDDRLNGVRVEES